MRLLAAALVATALVAAGGGFAAAVLLRYETVRTMQPLGVVLRDRWTGAFLLCRGDGQVAKLRLAFGGSQPVGWDCAGEKALPVLGVSPPE